MTGADMIGVMDSVQEDFGELATDSTEMRRCWLKMALENCMSR